MLRLLVVADAAPLDGGTGSADLCNRMVSPEVVYEK